MTKTQFRVAAGIVYALAVIALLLGLFRARHWAIEAYSDRAARSQWQSYRDDIARQSTEGNAPVRRRVPESTEPPALVLMRDYFAICVAISLVLTTALLSAMTFLVGGVLVGRDRAHEANDPSHPEDQASDRTS